jgi:UDP-N-acetylmuramoylalanine-D-glutamate ligase
VRLADLAGRRVVLLGLGADVTAAVPAVLGAGPAEVRVVVDDPPAGLAPGLAGAAIVSLEEAAAWAEVFVRSPGFPRYRPPLPAAVEAGAAVTTPLDLWLGTHGAGRTVVGITGTKGKSTVSDLVGRLAAAHGLRVGVAGNLGPPVFGDTWDHQAPAVALEVSSYQAADLHHVPDIAVVTHLAEDHLSWHGGVDRYVADKLRLLRNEGGTAGTILVAESSAAAREAIAAMGLDPVVVAAPPAPDELPVHRVANAALAAEVVHRLGGPAPTTASVVDAARSSLPGRLDRCEGPPGVLCLDDALASNPSATAAALAWLRGRDLPTVVLVGGTDRGVDLAPLVEEVGRWRPGRLHAVTLPDTGTELAARCGLSVVAVADSVESATRSALDAVGSGGVVLLSPAAPTPARIGNWQTRSDQFRAALSALALPTATPTPPD